MASNEVELVTAGHYPTRTPGRARGNDRNQGDWSRLSSPKSMGNRAAIRRQTRLLGRSGPWPQCRESLYVSPHIITTAGLFKAAPCNPCIRHVSVRCAAATEAPMVPGMMEKPPAKRALDAAAE